MRFVVFGAGAVGGVVCARLHQAGHEVALIARGAHLRPGAVEAYGARASGQIDLGRYPAGSDELIEQVAAALSESQFHSRVWPDVMRLKYAKRGGGAPGKLSVDDILAVAA